MGVYYLVWRKAWKHFVGCGKKSGGMFLLVWQKECFFLLGVAKSMKAFCWVWQKKLRDVFARCGKKQGVVLLSLAKAWVILKGPVSRNMAEAMSDMAVSFKLSDSYFT